MSRSLVPSVMGRDWWDWGYPPRLMDQHFGLGLREDDLFAPSLYRGHLMRPRRQPSSSGVSEIVNTADKFQVMVDVNHFAPEEVAVKITDNVISIHAKHEEKVDEHGSISREFTRRYVLPKDINPDTVVSHLTADGVLTLEAPKKIPQAEGGERVVPVTVKK